MIILGIDPGYATIGYGIVDYTKNKFTHISHGVITTKPTTPMNLRLAEIYKDLTDIIKMFKPDTAAIEELFWGTNVKTGVAVASARGVISLAVTHAGLPFGEYTPLQVKQAVVGYGRAEKNQVMQMVKSLLTLENIPRPDDAADALAVAICHGNSSVNM